MRIFLSAIKHMMLWGVLSGAGLGVLYGTVLAVLSGHGPLAGLLFGGVFGGGVGLLLGLPTGVLLGFINRCFARPNADSLEYGWTLGFVIADFAFAGAWFMFSGIFQWANNILVPGIPALITSLVFAFASKRFGEQFYYIYRTHEAPK